MQDLVDLGSFLLGQLAALLGFLEPFTLDFELGHERPRVCYKGVYFILQGEFRGGEGSCRDKRLGFGPTPLLHCEWRIKKPRRPAKVAEGRKPWVHHQPNRLVWLKRRTLTKGDERNSPGAVQMITVSFYQQVAEMQAPYFEKLREGISAPRLDLYRTPGDSDFELIAKYFWNVALCEALYPDLHTLEVALRNSIHAAAIDRYHTERWFEPPTSPLGRRGQDNVTLAKSELTKGPIPPEPHRIVSQLTFGFWVSLLNSRYEQILWPRMLLPAFPNMPRTIRTRKTLSARFHEIRKLRNLVFHHERISHWSNLAQCHDDVLETLDWVNPGLRQVLDSMNRFRQVFKSGSETMRYRLGEAVYPNVNGFEI